MRKLATSLLAAAAVAVFGVTAASAAPLFVEDFNYIIGSQLNGQGGWAAHSGGGTNPHTINTAGGLTYPGYPSSGIGNLLGPLAANGEDNNHTFTGQTSGSVYAAFMINVGTTTTTGDYLFHFFDGAIAGNVFRGRVFLKKDALSTNFAFGLQFGSAAPTAYTGFVYTPGTTYLVVLKYTFVAGATNDVVSLYVDPVTDCNEPAATLTTSDATQTDCANLDGVAIRQGGSTSGATAQLDGIRVATNWVDATCDPITPTHNSTWGQVKAIYR